MARRAKLLEKARNNPKNMRLDEVRKILVAFGFEARASGGTSHEIFTHGATGLLVNLQRASDGKAKAYQVKQVLDLIDDNNLGIPPRNEEGDHEK